MAAKKGKRRKLKDMSSSHKEYAAEINKTSLDQHHAVPKSSLDNKASHQAPGFDPVTHCLQVSSKLLGVAVGIAVLFVLLSVGMDGGEAAVSAIGGFDAGAVSPDALQWAFFLDMLFPFFYGGGIMLLVASFQKRGNRPLVRIILTALLIAVAADFAENALVFKGLSVGSENGFQFPLTVLKFGLIAFSGVLFTAIMPVFSGLDRLTCFILRYAFPLAIAILISGVAGSAGLKIVPASFPVLLLLLAIYATNKAQTSPAQT